MKFVMSLIAGLFATTTATAGILVMDPANSRKIEDVTVAQSATVTLENQAIQVSTLGAGVRSKKVLIANVKVYVAQVLSSDASKFVRTQEGALNSLSDSRTTVIALTFLRTVDAPTVQTSFKDALKANKVELSDAAVAGFLSAVENGGEATEGKTLVIALQKNADGSETVSYEDTNGKVTALKGLGLTQKIMSIWLGVPADSGIQKLKDALINGN